MLFFNFNKIPLFTWLEGNRHIGYYFPVAKILIDQQKCKEKIDRHSLKTLFEVPMPVKMIDKIPQKAFISWDVDQASPKFYQKFMK